MKSKKQTGFRLSDETLRFLDAGKSEKWPNRTAVLEAWVRLGYMIMLAEQSNRVATLQTSDVIRAGLNSAPVSQKQEARNTPVTCEVEP